MAAMAAMRGLGAGLLAGVFAWHSRRSALQTSYFLAVLPFTVHDMALSPNGHTVAVVGFSESERTNVLWLYGWRPRGEKAGETEGASSPFWSPDGKALGFFAAGKLKKWK